MRSILITGGVGDVMAIESMMTDPERESINCIFYASRAAKPCMELFVDLPSFPNIKKQTEIWKNFSQIFAFNDKKHLADKLCAYQPNALQEITRKLLEPIEDYSIKRIFAEKRPYTYSSFLKHSAASLEKFNLPEKYYCICPYSSNDKRDIRRDYNSSDWAQTLSILKQKDTIGVILNKGTEYIPDDLSLVNLNNKTNMKEAIEIVKRAQGYIGIDTAFSVLAAKLFDPTNIMVKCLNDHCFRWAHVYFMPLTKFDFLKDRIMAL